VIKITDKTYKFPSRFVRKDFPLLFPKSGSDEATIRAIASLNDIDYNGLRHELDLIQEPHTAKDIFRRRLRHFKSGYKSLFVAVEYEGEQCGIDLSRYAIHKPKLIDFKI
jgi:hypothetical protein